jgi:hypothetical protein
MYKKGPIVVEEHSAKVILSFTSSIPSSITPVGGTSYPNYNPYRLFEIFFLPKKLYASLCFWIAESKKVKPLGTSYLGLEVPSLDRRKLSSLTFKETPYQKSQYPTFKTIFMTCSALICLVLRLFFMHLS